MRYLFILLYCIPLTLLAQKDEVFAKFINEDGTIIKGSSLVKLYERQIPVNTVESNASTNSTVVRITMNREPAADILQNLMLTGKKMRSGEMVVTYISYDRRLVRYKITMENIAVAEVSEINGNITIQLKAARIGWTNYSYTKSGIQTIISKTGWDAERRSSWTAF